MKSAPTGERLEVTDLSENTAEHLHRYALARTFCINKAVLDIASGEGYGSYLLANQALKVTGVDLDAAVVTAANRKYVLPNLQYKQGDATKIPCDDNSFDVVVSFETLEHHAMHHEMMAEIKRVLKPSGTCIISTPDKLIYSDKKNYANPFHVKELYKQEFVQLLSGYFKHVTLLKQRFLSGSLIIPDSQGNSPMTAFEGDFASVHTMEGIDGEYLLGIASDSPVEANGTSFFIDNDFGKKKILDFQRQSIRYKAGKALLTPGRLIKNILGRKGK
jgi:ubiquinone/menaquinone biosynthesis C-methylase UbiE